MKLIFILFLVSTNGNITLLSEYSSKQNCLIAADKVREFYGNSWRLRYDCVPAFIEQEVEGN